MLTHISNNYLFSTVHSSLAISLADKRVGSQFVYCPLQRKVQVNSAIGSNGCITVASPRVFRIWMRYLPLTKVLISFVVFIFALKKHKVRPSFIIAHNLWSDGMVAWLYNKCTGTPYIVAVRNTDINFFLPRLIHFRFLIQRIVNDSKRTIFINNAYFYRLKLSFPSVFGSISDSKVIYNGVNAEWLDSPEREEGSSLERKYQVIYVGSFLPNKNLKNSVQAIRNLNKKSFDIKFVVIGGTEIDFMRCTDLSEIPCWVTVIPKTQDRALIASYLRESRVFLMPSFHETFGLVYVEALSQGCCLIHSQNEGIDGVFNEPFIKSVDPHNVDDIANKVDSLVSQFPFGVSKADVKRLTADFSWAYIAEQYIEIINEETN